MFRSFVNLSSRVSGRNFTFGSWAGCAAVCGLIFLSALPPITKAQFVATAKVNQEIISPFAGLKNFGKWEIEIANRSDEDVPATVTVYSVDGEPISQKSVELGRNRISRIDIHDLLSHEASRHQADEVGEISVEATAKPFAIAAQVTLSEHHGGFGNIDSILLPDAMFPSNTMDAVWWQPQDGKSFLIVANSSTENLAAEITFGSGERESLTLGAKAMRLIAGPNLRPDKSAQSVHVTANGLPG